jgi:uncharacterized membrane protein
VHRVLAASILLLVGVLLTPWTARAQGTAPLPTFERGVVVDVVERGPTPANPTDTSTDRIKVRLETGTRSGDVVDVESVRTSDRDYLQSNVGDRLVLTRDPGTGTYYVANAYRLPGLLWLAIGFLVLVLAVGRLRGLTSLLGLAVSVLVIVKFLVPSILDGRSPLLASLLAAAAILASSLYLAHGFRRSTSVALVSSLVTLGIAALLAVVAANVSHVFGFGSEEANFVQLSALEFIDPRGLLLAGILIGALGVLDDVTIGQAVAVAELKAAQPALTFRELYRRAERIGRHHVASLVNTLFLAYAGASLPLFLLFSEFKTNPLWLVVNSEPVSEEIVRTLVGSAALVLAVPISTALATWVYTRKRTS